MKRFYRLTRLSALIFLTALALMFVFDGQAAAQFRGVRAFADCVEVEYVNGAETGNYIAYFGYSNSESTTAIFPQGGPNNFFFPEEFLPQNKVSVFVPGVHPRVVSVKVPIGQQITWILGIGYATASFNNNNLCGSDGANSRLITYQGKLSDGAAAANGVYDLQFQLFSQLTGGTARTSLITLDDVQVTNGVFTVRLDLGASALTEDYSAGSSAAGNLKLNPAILDAQNSFFEIGVRAGTSTGAYTVLTPRQPITAVPLAMRANTANNAFRAANADKLGGLRPDEFIQNTTTKQSFFNFNIGGNGTIGGNLTVGGTINGTVSNATNLGGTAASQFVQTTDSRLSDARTPTAGSADYIQNTTTQQSGSFNISGSGTVGGTLTANTATVNQTLTATTTNISGATERLLNVQGSSPIGTWITLNNTTTGGHNWSIISTGESNGEGAGKLLFYDLANNTGRLLLSDSGATITGNLTVSGAISGATKNFKIDHPLDPLNKTLTYTSVESPDMMNIYNGNITTNAEGEAIVTMPDYFEALNKDFRYQLTVIGTFAQAIILEKIKGNQFKIKTDKPNVEVSWQVAGIRHDKFAEENRPAVEQNKPDAEKNKCVYAPACGQK